MAEFVITTESGATYRITGAETEAQAMEQFHLKFANAPVAKPTPSLPAFANRAATQLAVSLAEMVTLPFQALERLTGLGVPSGEPL